MFDIYSQFTLAATLIRRPPSLIWIVAVLTSSSALKIVLASSKLAHLQTRQVDPLRILSFLGHSPPSWCQA